MELRHATLLVLGLLLQGCGPLPGDVSPGAKTGEEDQGPFPPTLQAIQENVFDPICTECHAGNSPLGGLSLDDVQTSYDSLVDVDARREPFKRVAPGDPDNSYIIHKLEGTQQQGARMPKGQEPLDQATIDVIRKWIENGALLEEPEPGP